MARPHTTTRRRLAAVTAATGVAGLTAALTLIPGASGTSGALPGENVTVRAATAKTQVCHRAPRPGAAGVATTPYAAGTTAEALTVRTDGGATGDWDLAVFDHASGRRLAASATSTARERVTVLLAPGQRVDVQACRLAGGREDLVVGLEPYELPAAATRTSPDGAGGVRMVRVRVDRAEDVHRLEELGLDVTHNATAGGVDVVLYGDEQLRRLRNAGFEATTVVADLAAADRASLARDAAAPRVRAGTRALPSGRTTYRNYEDFGVDLKQLAADHPGHVRLTTLPGGSLEGRPLEGVEISKDVGRPDDGRPIFLLAGNTHARE
jgi:hypothetical protein